MKNKNINKNKQKEQNKRKNARFKKGKYKNKRESMILNIEPNETNIKVKKRTHLRNLNKAKILLVTALLIAILIYMAVAVYNLVKNPTDTVVVKEGQISEEETVNGYIMRDETVIKGENYKNGMMQIKSEGEKVANGDPIFRYYSSGEEELKNKIADLDIKIQEAM